MKNEQAIRVELQVAFDRVISAIRHADACGRSVEGLTSIRDSIRRELQALGPTEVDTMASVLS